MSIRLAEMSATGPDPTAAVDYIDGNPCMMFPRTGAEKKVRRKRPKEYGSSQFHGRSETVRAIAQ
jgi:hypothetical protein